MSYVQDISEVKLNEIPEKPRPLTSGKIQIGFYQTDIEESYDHMLSESWRQKTHSYSLWACKGSERMSPTTIAVSGLFDSKQYSALLDGNWDKWAE